MILPEPDRNRPTVALDRNAVPGPVVLRALPASRAVQDRARADRALQDRVRHERAAALLETSPFWKPEAARRTPPSTPIRGRHRGRAAGRAQPRRPAAGAVRPARPRAWSPPSSPGSARSRSGSPSGTATGAPPRSPGAPARASPSAARPVHRRGRRLPGRTGRPARGRAGAAAPGRESRRPGWSAAGSRQAYLGGTGVLVHLRWALGFVLVLLCGLGIAGLTGARRLDTARCPARGRCWSAWRGRWLLLAGFL